MNRLAKCKRFIKQIIRWPTHRWTAPKPGLYVFNYHRIGDAHCTEFDPNVFSCSAEQFERHLLFYKQHFVMLNQAELLALVAQNRTLDKPYGLITFDDGYVDSYSRAFPLLKKHELSAIFFIVCDYASAKGISWWDEVAWLIKNNPMGQLRLPHWTKSVDFTRVTLSQGIRNALSAFKQDHSLSMDAKLQLLRNQCQHVKVPKAALFASWSQLCEMLKAGMGVGSHTVDHPILAHLAPSLQKQQLVDSQLILQQQLQQPVHLLAYPVGSSESYSAQTAALAEQVGYSIAFTFSGQINDQQCLLDHRFELSRIAVDCDMGVQALQQHIIRLGREHA